MTKYLTYSLTSIAYLYYTFATIQHVRGQRNIMPNILDITACILFAIAAGLFLCKKDRLAGIISLISLGMTARVILQNWYFFGQFMDSNHAVSLFIFISVSTLFLLFLFIVSIKSVIIDNNDFIEIFKINLGDTTRKMLSILPGLIIIGATLVMWTLMTNNVA